MTVWLNEEDLLLVPSALARPRLQEMFSLVAGLNANDSNPYPFDRPDAPLGFKKMVRVGHAMDSRDQAFDWAALVHKYCNQYMVEHVDEAYWFAEIRRKGRIWPTNYVPLIYEMGF